MHTGNYPQAEKFLRKALCQSEALLGNEAVNKLNADIYENLGLVEENRNKPIEALSFYKKALRNKFNFYGEKHDQVLDIQYKISCVSVSEGKFKEAEEILTSVCNVIVKEKSKQPKVEKFYRYAVYFYTLGFCQLKTSKPKKAKSSLEKAKLMWEDILHSNDSAMTSLNHLLSLCDRRT